MSEQSSLYTLAHEASIRLANAGIGFGIYSGGHAALLAGHRTVRDIDIWADEKQIDTLRRTFPEAELKITQQSAEGPGGFSADGFMLELGSGEVSIMGATKDIIAGTTYNVGFDGVRERTRWQTLGGLTSSFVDPVDTVLFKALSQRGPEQGKRDIEDILAIAGAVTIDVAYLLQRIASLQAEPRAIPLLRKLGILTIESVD